jgi:translocation and assembly module TamA
MTRCTLWRALIGGAGVLALLLAAPGLRAAVTLTYSVTVAKTGNDAIDAAMSDASTLATLRDKGAVAPLALLARARADQDRLVSALHSLGHYDGAVAITLDGLPLDDPTLPDRLDTLNAAAAAIQVTPGPLFHLRHIVIIGDTDGAGLNLQEGAPAIATAVLGAATQLEQTLRDSGHAFAQVDAPIADLDTAAQALDVTYNVTAGPRVDIGPISVSGTQSLRPAYVLHHLTLRPGMPYDPRTLESARADLASVPAIASVRLVPAAAVDASGRLPVTAEIVERKLRAVTLTAAFSTDQGGNLSATWLHRNLFGGAEQLTVFAAATELGAGAAKQPGYRIGSTLTLPDWLVRDQSLSFSLIALRESLDAYDRTASIAGATLTRRLTPQITVSAGLAAERALITQDDVARNYALLQTPLTLHFDSTDSPTDPTKGWRGEAIVTPTQSLSRQNATFFITQLDGSTYVDLAPQGRTVLALRGLIGSLSGAGALEIPPDQRFYAGGSGTLRGFRYQSVGPKLGNGKPEGGSALASGTVELRQRIGASWGAVAFLDGAELGAGSQPFGGRLQLGAGLGVRYYTSLGPIRLDIAAPLQRQHGDDIGELYIGLGQAF